MIWTAPWAWLGAIAIAAPIAIHLLTRDRATPLPFPTLRFLTGLTTTSARRRQLRDVVLLAIRCAMLVAVVAAGAGPVFTWLRGASPAASTLRRAIVIDTSASMSRMTPAGRTALDDARTRAAALTPVAGATRTIERARLDSALTEAAAWVGSGPGRREIVVYSDFQRGVLDAAQVAALPSTIGLQFVRIDAPAPAALAASVGVGARTLTARASIDGDTTSVAWRNAFAAPPLPVQIVAGEPHPAGVDAAIEAAQAQGLPTGTAAHAIAVVASQSVAATASSVRAVDEPWMFDAIAQVQRDAAVTAAAERRAAAPVSAPPALAILARDRDGRPVLAAGTTVNGSTKTLELFVLADDPLLFSATIVAASRAAVPASAWAEMEPATIDAATLAQWTRATPPAPPVPATDDGRSDARWCWAIALALVAIETWLRRSTASGSQTEAAHARVA